VDIDPSRPPEVPISGTNLRKQFSWLRTKMTKLFEDFKRSGQIMEGEDHADGDDEFLSAALEDTTFRWERNVLLYVYVIYDRAPPSWCMRAAPEETQLDIGCDDDTQSTSARTSRKRTASASENTMTILPGPGEDQYYKHMYSAEKVETLTKYISNPEVYDLSEADVAKFKRERRHLMGLM